MNRPSAAYQTQRQNIGIIAGSGPESGVDLWHKILKNNQKRFGKHFRGDLDAPNVTIISDPRLGLSMELEQHHHQVWESLREDIEDLSQRVVWYAIACNTLNFFAERIRSLNLSARLISFTDCVRAYLRRNHIMQVCLLGARPVMDLGPWSAYRRLPELVDVEVLGDIQDLHRLIYDIKTYGPDHGGLANRFEEMLSGITSRVVLLACTELPLLRGIKTSKTLIDVTELVVEALVDRSFINSTNAARLAKT